MENKTVTLTEKLTPIMRTFAERYVIHLNGRRAAQEAGCTGKSIDSIASQLLSHPLVSPYIEHLRQQQMDNMGVTKDRVLLELCRMAYVDPGDLYDDQGCIKNIKDMPEDVRRSISSIETKEIYEQDGRKKKYVGDAKRVKLGPKEKALEMLCKHLGLFQLDNLQKSDVTIIVTGNESLDIWNQLNSEY